MTGRTASLRQLTVISIALATLVWCVFGQTLSHRFVNFDDQSYVYANSVISRGLSFSSIGWAFTHTLSHNWHPLTAISHLLDCQLFDLKPAGHHFTNVLLHSISAVLLMLALFRMTGALWQSACVAALFAVHPLRVESVAWISERKDVLSGFFFMLTLLAYAGYARKTFLRRYLFMSVLLACGLMSKPMLVTVPIILLLLDYWPLGRFGGDRANLSRLFLEKIPLLIMAAIVGLVTIRIQQHGINFTESISLPWRMGNAIVSTGVYLQQFVWPTGLAVFYPHAGAQLPFWQIVITSILLIGVTVAALLLRKNYPYFFCGWFWYLVMLMPIIGIIQVGDQAHADRYTYLPQIGIALTLVWGIGDLSRRLQIRYVVLTAAGALAIGLFAWLAAVQTTYWRDSESLWNRTLAVTKNNDLAHERLSSALLDQGRPDDAILHAELAININNRDGSAENDLGAALARRGQPDEALKHFRKGLELDPSLSSIHYNIANALAAEGNTAEAVAEYKRQLAIAPGFAEAHNNLAMLLVRMGRFAEAEDHLAKALSSQPNYPEAHNNLAIVLSQRGQIEEAIGQWEKTISIDPNNLDANANLAWVLATSPMDSVRNGSAALEHAQRALKFAQSNPRIWRLVAVAQAALGNFDAAIEAAGRARALAQDQNNAALVQTIESNIELFRNRQAVRDISR